MMMLFDFFCRRLLGNNSMTRVRRRGRCYVSVHVRVTASSDGKQHELLFDVVVNCTHCLLLFRRVCLLCVLLFAFSESLFISVFLHWLYADVAIRSFHIVLLD